jgi:hypothetical protein
VTTLAPSPASSRHCALAVLRRTPWWAAVLGIWAASRLVTTSILLSFAARQGENAWTGASPGYLDFARLWDAHWYYIISVVGYPSEIPRDENGLAGESAWAFMPVYPGLSALAWRSPATPRRRASPRSP